jgi:hypothetical protein
VTDSALWKPCPACLSGEEKVNDDKKRVINLSIMPWKNLPVTIQALAEG